MIRAAIAALVLLIAPAALGQYAPGAQPAGPPAARPDRGAELDAIVGRNPIEIIEGAARMVPGRGAEEGGLAPALNVLILLTVLTLVPSIVLMTTCFVRILIVLGLLRQALGAASVPPPQVITGLALFMTLLVMAPTAQRVYDEAIVPYQSGEVRDYDALWKRVQQPMRDFMFDQIEATGNTSSLLAILNYRGVDTSRPEELRRSDVDLVTLVPAYMLSELKAAFVIGFKIYLPFLVIDMVIATMLISMSMMMLPPVLVSLPFKLLLFVLVDGWTLVAGSLLESFVGDSGAATASAAGVAPVVEAVARSILA